MYVSSQLEGDVQQSQPMGGIKLTSPKNPSRKELEHVDGGEISHAR